MSLPTHHDIFCYASVDKPMFLNHETPPGLLRTECGEEYLIVSTTEGVRAVVLNASHIPTFGVVELTFNPLAYGWWKGPFIVRLKGSSVLGYHAPAPLGLITTGDFSLEISCCARDGTVQHVPLGYAKNGVPEDHVIDFFDDWELIEQTTGIVFFQRPLGLHYPCTQFGGYREPRAAELITVEFPS
jgi:hypothetical protein